jgi:putative nucleotidyltransferase with HDIG domain
VIGLTAENEDLTAVLRSRVLKDLPPYRPVARKLMTLTSTPEVPLARIQEVLRTDAAFTADVLRLANSPLFGSRGEIRSVIHAVMMLGLERVKSMATTLALKSFLSLCASSDAIEACWRHNLATAIVCEKLAHPFQIDPDTCYTAGLLHDIGRLVLLRTDSASYESIFSSVTAPDFDLLNYERGLFGVDHCQAGQWVLEKWEFPKELCEVASRHHTPPGAGASDLRRIVYAGWRIADLLGFSELKHPAGEELATIASVLPENVGRQLIDDCGIAEEVAFKINSIECSLV